MSALHLLRCGGFLATFLATAPAAAQVTPFAGSGSSAAAVGQATAGDSADSQRFQVPTSRLADALADYSRQAGVSVVLEVSRLPDVRVTGFSGRFTREHALRRLLEGTGLFASFVEPHVVVIASPETATGRTGAHALHPVVVTAGSARAKGYAARRSSSATRTDTPLLDTPQSVTVVTSEVIADQGMQSLADVVRYVPGITMGTGEGHRDQPTIRGNNTTADFFVDGLRDDAQFFRDLYNVDRVEALKGPNAMVFGRGGGGGVLNRVLKEAQWAPHRELRLEGGAHDHRRATLDIGQGAGRVAAARLNAMIENSGGFRDAAHIERRAVNPTAAFALGARTTLRGGFEHLHDERVVDRGIPSYQGLPAPIAISTFFGNPATNQARATNNLFSATLDHATAAQFALRSRLQLADYDKYYQNTVPGAVNTAGSEVTLTAYSDAMRRRNAISQTDLLFRVSTGALHHSFVVGTEISRQRTYRLRRTGYFNDGAASASVPLSAPTVVIPVTFRAGTSDPDTRSVVSVGAAYLQDQITVLPELQVLLGLRHDRFHIRSDNQRTGEELRRVDNLFSPRVGLVLKPASALSVYASHSISHLPSAGDQFTSLSLTTRDMEPERFTNRELGVKWEPFASLALAGAVYRLDRTNTAAPDPDEPTRMVQTGSQRSSGIEVDVTGSIVPAWQVIAGYAAQRARITSTTTAAPAGAIAPMVPERTFTLWNRLDLHSRLGAGVGVVHQSAVYAAVDNKVRLPAFTRVDAALYVQLFRQLRAQANVENVFDERYYPTAHNNNNIMPGAPRTLRLSLTSAF